MFSKIAALEFGKQKKSFLGWLLVFGLTMIVVNLEGLARHRNLAEAFSAVLAITIVGGIPLLAILFGVSAAAGLREDAARKAEEMLPFSPGQRVFGAYFTSLSYFLLTCAFLALLGFAFGSGSHFKELPDSFQRTAPAFPLLMIHLHVLSFVLTYWIKNSIFSAGLAAILVGSETYLFWCLVKLFGMRHVAGFPPSIERQLYWCLFLVAVASISSLLILIPISRRIEHENKITIPLGLVSLLVISFSVPFLYFSLEASTRKFETHLSPLWYPWFYAEMKNPVIGPVMTRGLLLETVSGDLIRVSPSKRELLYKSTTSPKDSEFEEYLTNHLFRSSYFTSDGTFWLLMQPDELNQSLYEIRKTEASGPLSLMTSFRSDVSFDLLAEENGVLRIYGTRAGSSDYVSAGIPKPGDPLVVVPSVPAKNLGILPATYARRLEALKNTDQAAHLDAATEVLTQVLADGKTKTWELSAFGKVVPWDESVISWSSSDHINYIPRLFRTKEGDAFALVIEQNDKRRNVVVCMPDGSIEYPWKHSGSSSQGFWRRRIPGGTVWKEKTPAGVLLVTSAEGKFYPPLEIKKLQLAIYGQSQDEDAWLDVRRLEGDQLWAIIQNEFVLIDLRNGTVARKLGNVGSTNGNLYWNIYTVPTQEGVYFIQNERIYLIDWDGRKQDLGPAYL
jgi:hypothetical protein